MQNQSRKKRPMQWVSSHINKRELLTFLTFLLCTSIVWFVQALNREREATLKFPVAYDNLSRQRAFVSKLPEFIEVKVKARGSELISKTLTEELPTIHIDAQDYIVGNRLIVPYDDLHDLVNAALSKNFKIVNIEPGNIDIEWQQLAAKTVPVILNASISPASQHIITAEPSVSPDQITIFGAKEVLDSIAGIKTQKVVIGALDNSLLQEIALILPDNVQCDNRTTTLSAKAEAFTERRFKAKVNIRNVPASTIVKVFPEVVDVCANVLQKDFASADADEIKVVFDYSQASGNSLVPLRVDNTANTWFNIRITPASADYLVERVISEDNKTNKQQK